MAFSHYSTPWGGRPASQARKFSTCLLRTKKMPTVKMAAMHFSPARGPAADWLRADHVTHEVCRGAPKSVHGRSGSHVRHLRTELQGQRLQHAVKTKTNRPSQPPVEKHKEPSSAGRGRTGAPSRTVSSHCRHVTGTGHPHPTVLRVTGATADRSRRS